MPDNQLEEAETGNNRSTRHRLGGPYRHFQRRYPTVYHASARSLSRVQPVFVRQQYRPIAEKRHRRALLQWLKREKRKLQKKHKEKRRVRADQAEDEAETGNSSKNEADFEQEEEGDDDGNENNSNIEEEESLVDYESEVKALDNAMIEVQRTGNANKYSVPEQGVRGTMDPDTWAVHPDGYTDMGDRSMPERRLWQGPDDYLMSSRRRLQSNKRSLNVPIVPAATLGLPDEGLLKSLNVYAMELLGGAVAAENYEGRFDESALLALGIVVEEHLGEMLGPTGHRVYAEYEQNSEKEAVDKAIDEAEESNQSENESHIHSKSEAVWGKPLMYDGRRSREAKRMDFLTCLKTNEENFITDVAGEDSGNESGNYHTEQESEPDDVDAIDVNNSFNLSGQKYKPAVARRRPLGSVDHDSIDRTLARSLRMVSRDTLEDLF